MRFYVFLICLLSLSISCNKKKIEESLKENPVPVVKDTVIEKDNTFNSKEIEKNETSLFFSVQIAALKNENDSLDTIEGVHTYFENDLTKYRLGNFISYREARAYRLKLLNKYPDAFIQALKNNNPIPIKEALQY